MPARYLSRPSDSATVLQAYETTELGTEVGDVLDVVEVDRPGGWLWCRSATAEEGWVPSNTVDYL